MKYLVFLLVLFLSSCSSVRYGHRSPANTDASSCHSAIKKIFVRNQEITIGDTYVLGDVTVKTTEYISQGNVGYVFKAEVIEGVEKLREKEFVLKVEKQKSPMSALTNQGDLFYNVSQFKALSYLEEINFPAVRVHASNFDYSVMLLDYVKGYDFKQYADVFRVDQKFINSLIEFDFFLKELETKMPEVIDVRLANIMFDLKTGKWIIVDASRAGDSRAYQLYGELRQYDQVVSTHELIQDLFKRYPHYSKSEINDLVLKKTKVEDGKYHIYHYIFNGPEDELSFREKLFENIRWKNFQPPEKDNDFIYIDYRNDVKKFIKNNEFENSKTNCLKLKAFKKLFKDSLKKSQKKVLKDRIPSICQ